MKIYLLLLLILLLGFQITNCQTPSTQGKEFWLSFMKNYDNNAELKLIISGKRSCTGVVKNGSDNTVIANFAVNAGQLTNVLIPSKYSSQTSEKIEKLGIVVQSTDTISLYASNYEDRSFDVTNVLPTAALSDSYCLQTYPTDVFGAEFLIVATEDNTVVDITPTALTVGGKPANKSFSVTLNKGQSYQVLTSSESGDFSGTFIKTRDCKKLAVFNGNLCARIPYGCAFCDHIVEQTLPIYYWGKHFAITNSVGRSNDKVRVTASKDGTKVYKNDILQMTLNKGGTYEFAITSTEKSCYIETSEPSAVNLYFVGANCGNSTYGDPSSVWISPIEQKINDITFGTFQTAMTTSHYTNVVTDAAGVASMTLDGVNVAGKFSPLSGNTALSFARISIEYGSHTLKNSTGFTAFVYGYGTAESYGYSVGSNAKNLNKQILINGIPSSQILPDESFCVNSIVSFKPSVDFSYSAVLWDFGDGDVAVGETVSHRFKSTGMYQVKMITQLTESTCNGMLSDTVSFNLNIAKKEFTFNDLICVGSRYTKHGFNTIVNSDTTLIRKATSELECDSTITVHLKVGYPSTTLTKAVICQNDSFLFNGNSYKKAGLYSVALTSSAGCDSIASLELVVNPVFDIKDYRTICSDDLPYTYADTIFQVGTKTNTYKFFRKTINGCDSIVTLALTVYPVKLTLLSDTIVQNKSYNGSGFSLPLQQHYGNFTFSQNLKTIYGCDSTVTLNLKVSPDFSALMRLSPKICADDKYFTLGYDILYGSIEYHSVIFDSKARKAGFTDIPKQTANGAYIDVFLPIDAIPDIYNASVIFDNGSVTKTLPVTFIVDYPSSIIVQKWNDVLALLNRGYNGGYDFANYQWYKNGQAIEGATKSYLYTANDKLDTNAEYSVKITRMGDGVTLFTCPIRPTLHTDVAIFPTLLSKAGNVTIDIEGTGSALLMDASGIKLRIQPLNNGINNFTVPAVSGTYLLLVKNEKGESRTQLLIVK